MNNILMLVIDSMNNTHIKESKIELTPFLNSLKEKGVYSDSMYSQAPYTEAATMGIYCGTDVLDNGGYLFRYKNAPLTIFEAMKQKGYDTYFNSFQPQCHPSSLRRGVDEIYYSVGYDLGALWSYRLSHYARLLKEKSITDADFSVLKEIFEDNFSEWLRFLDDLLSDDKSVNMLSGNTKQYNASLTKDMVVCEYEKYSADNKGYIVEVLISGTSHRLFSIPKHFQDNKIKDRSVLEYVRKEYTPLMKKIRSMDFKLNMKNCRGIYKGPCRQVVNFVKKPSVYNLKNIAKGALLSINQVFDTDLFDRIDSNYDSFKNAPSMRTHTTHYLNWREERCSDKPHFAVIHVDDIHNPEMFFTYDTEDRALLEKEKNIAAELLSRIPSDYQGSLSHDLSLRYIDSVIEDFFEEMRRKGYLEDTTVLICADHGFSFGGNPLRDSAVINLYLENYNIPFVVYGPGIEHKEIKGLRQSKDIPATLCDLADGNIPSEISGHSVFEDFSYEELLIEYCGGGCPDLSRRDIKMASYNEDLFVGTLAKLDEPITKSNITEVYNLKNDPKQIKNLVNSYSADELQPFVDHLNQRKTMILRSSTGGKI